MTHEKDEELQRKLLAQLERVGGPVDRGKQLAIVERHRLKWVEDRHAFDEYNKRVLDIILSRLQRERLAQSGAEGWVAQQHLTEADKDAKLARSHKRFRGELKRRMKDATDWGRDEQANALADLLGLAETQLALFTEPEPVEVTQ